MRQPSAPFPLRGVVGILSRGDPLEERHLEAVLGGGLGGVEIRADLLLSPAHGSWSRERLLEALGDLRRRGVRTIFTVRVPAHGGVYDGSEEERLELYRAALDIGADIVDVEWGTPAQVELTRQRQPLIVSAHFFDRMLRDAELRELTASMTAAGALAVKLVPTATRLGDALTLLEWVSRTPERGPARIGFAMGDRGVWSRVLCLARGSPISYGGLGRTVAPGQLSARELLEVYGAPRLGAGTRVLGVVGNRALSSCSPYLHNPALRRRAIDAVYLPFQVDDFEEVPEILDPVGVDGLSVTVPFKEDALRLADHLDSRSRAHGATNTLVLRRGTGGRRIEGFNTDPDGVLLPLRRRLDDLAGISVGVIGDGGAARGAVLALREAGASPTLYYRNRQPGAPVAVELGVAGQPLAALATSRPRVLINATPLGSQPGDPSPVPAECLRAPAGEAPRLALELIHHPAETPFLLAARAAGAVEIPGREMLVARGLAQFALFTGHEASAAEFESHYRQGDALRHGSSRDESQGA